MRTLLVGRWVLRFIATAMCVSALLVFSMSTSNRVAAQGNDFCIVGGGCCKCTYAGTEYDPTSCTEQGGGHYACVCGQAPDCGCVWSWRASC